jgi:hypothetical protein
MVLSEILSTTFLFSIAIIIILVGGLFAYFNHRFTQQNHKILSMMALVSTMAEEMQFFRSKINAKSQPTQDQSITPANTNINTHLGGTKTIFQSNLIEVSDDEHDEDDEEQDDDDVDDDEEQDDDDDVDDEEQDDEEQDDEQDDDDDVDDDEQDDDVDDEEQDEPPIKNFQIDLGEDINIDFDHDDIEISEGQKQSQTKTINLSHEISSFDDTSTTLQNIDEIELKLNDTNDNTDTESSVDYSKMALNKLREIIVSKGIVVDASKLKKNDILKMLSNK